MIQYVRLAFIEKGTEHMERIYYSWLLTFICRLWLSWIIKTPKEELDDIQSQFFDSDSSKSRQKSKRQFFITTPAYMVGLQTCHLFRVKLMIDISFRFESHPRRKHLFLSE